MRIRRAVWPALLVVVLIGVLFVAVFPTRTWLTQRRETAGAVEQLRILDEQNSRLAARVDALHEDDEIERLAREQYNLVKPGEEAYALLPAPGSEGDEPRPPAKAERKRSVPARIWHFLTGWM